MFSHPTFLRLLCLLRLFPSYLSALGLQLWVTAREESLKVAAEIVRLANATRRNIRAKERTPPKSWILAPSSYQHPSAVEVFMRSRANLIRVNSQPVRRSLRR